MIYITSSSVLILDSSLKLIISVWLHRPNRPEAIRISPTHDNHLSRAQRHHFPRSWQVLGTVPRSVRQRYLHQSWSHCHTLWGHLHRSSCLSFESSEETADPLFYVKIQQLTDGDVSNRTLLCVTALQDHSECLRQHDVRHSFCSTG